MSNMKIGIRINGEDFKVFNEIDLNLPTLPSDRFFELDRSGGDFGEYLPLPNGAERWYNALYREEPVYYTEVGEHVYFIGVDSVQGYALFHYVRENGSSILRYSNVFPVRRITNERSKNLMPISTPSRLSTLANQQNQSRTQVSNMQLPDMPGQPAFGGYTQPANDGIQGGSAATVDTIVQNAVGRGYVFGYILKNAPMISAYAKRITVEGDKKRWDVGFKQTKPSGILSVLITLPKRCIMYGNEIQDPTKVMNGQVSFDAFGRDDMISLALQENAAIAYIAAYGGKLPEYAPNVTDRKDQWTAREILNDNGDVSFVEVKCTANRGKNQASKPFIFRLKCKGPRRSLFTPKNITCLNARVHRKVPTGLCKTETEAYELNECAFGDWRYRADRSGGASTEVKALQSIYADAVGQIWRKKYTGLQIKGKEEKTEDEEGIGSIYFTTQNSMQLESDQAPGDALATHATPQYIPWYKLSMKKTSSMEVITPVDVPFIVKKEAKITSKGTPRMSSTIVKWKDCHENGKIPGAEMFAPYKEFTDEILNRGYVTLEQLERLCSRSTRKPKVDEQDPKMQRHLLEFMGGADVSSAVADFKKHFTTLGVINDAEEAAAM